MSATTTKKTLIIAEKPSVARDLARVLGANRHGDGLIEADRYTITWCFGHLAELAEPETYDPAWAQWSLSNLPMIPKAFALRATDSGAEQFARVATLLTDPRFEDVINACDAGREGELIFGYVYELAGSSLPVRRLWIASLTEDAIREGMKGLRPGREFRPLYEAARARSQADWLVGLNATRCVTLSARTFNPDARVGLISVGRVQTPTLGLLVARTRERERFTPSSFYTVAARFDAGADASYDGVLIEGADDSSAWRLPDSERARSLARALEALGASAPARVESLEREESRRAPPQFFDLTSLQQLANTRLGFSAKRTLDLAQSLYETHKLLTYPRTDSRHITPDLAATLPSRLGAAMRLPALSALAGSLSVDMSELGRRLVNASKVTDHHAILPTDADPSSATLSKDEAALYELVARRLCAAISPPARVASTRVVTLVGEMRFVTRGSQLLSPGWKVFEDAHVGSSGDDAHAQGDRRPDDADDDADADADAIPATLSAGARVALVGSQVKSGATRPPAAYTEATLLGAMERAGGALEDDTLREALRGAGLGTPATRADTIETLIRREYIERKGKTVVATSLGAQVIDALEAFPHLTDARLTGRWESMLTRVADGEYPAEAFMEKVEQMTRAIVAHFTAHPPRIKGKEREVLGACPACRTRQVLVSKKGAWCQGLRDEECDFVIGRVLARKTLTVPQLKRLLAHGSHPGVKGFTSKAGKKFDAPLKLERREAQDGWRVAFDFPERAPREDLSGAPVVGACPKCGGQVALGSRSARCTAPGCDVSLWRTVCGKELGAEVLTELLRERETPELSGFVSKKNKRFATALVLVEDPERGWKIGFPERAPRSTGKTKAKKTSSKATTP